MAKPAKDKALTPMLQQYCEIKAQHPDCLLFFRLGDFYELFFEDAKIASKELNLVLTARAGTPMCGVPHFASETHIANLLRAGYRVAICEQVGDPALAKGLVPREVVRIVSPGTVTDAAMLDERANNFLMAVCAEGNAMGFACADLSTGCLELSQTDSSLAALRRQLAAYHPSEILAEPTAYAALEQVARADYRQELCYRSYDLLSFDLRRATERLCAHYRVQSLQGLDLAELPVSVRAAGALMHYLEHTQKHALPHLRLPKVLRPRDALILDECTCRNLEILCSLSGSKRGSLLGLLDRTRTAMGARLLRRNLERPLADRDAIRARLSTLEELTRAPAELAELRKTLGNVRDMERLCGRLSLGNLSPRECLALGQSMGALPGIKRQLHFARTPLLRSLADDMDALEDLCDLISRAIHPKAPAAFAEGGVIADGYDPEIDRLRGVSLQSKGFLAKLEAAERERTGIKNLKVGYNRVFGYYIEVTKSNLDLVPYEYTRKQTLAGCERYITDQLKSIEEEVLSAQERLVQLEVAAYEQLRDALCACIRRIQDTSDALAMLDFLAALADCALEYNYVRPTLADDRRIHIRKGRHPVVEHSLGDGAFVPNDALLDDADNRMLILTGPNMSGKSTYLRQVALIVLMTHIGSFVPAESAQIGEVDRIFTRIGASDDIASGRSTFMVEMSETAAILNGATRDSLIVLDEIGRGTGTFDGLAIAQAVIEHLCQGAAGPRTLFSTHYHELSRLQGQIPGVKNYRVSVREEGEDVVFLRSIQPGGSDKSFGLHVARISGIPQAVCARAGQILRELEQSRPSAAQIAQPIAPSPAQTAKPPALPGEVAKLLSALCALDLNDMTPLQAMRRLFELQAIAQALPERSATP